MSCYPNRNSGYMGATTSERIQVPKFIRVDDVVHEIHTVVVHRFKMGDVEDPDLYAAEPLMDWQKSEMGIWVMAKAVQIPEWHRHNNPASYHTEYAVVAKLKGVDHTFWTLKWSNSVDRIP